MAVPPELFDEDYVFFYEKVLGEERSGREAELVARLLALEPGMRVLDLPCGDGRIAGRLAQRRCEVVGIDRSEMFLDLGRRRWPDVTFEQGDMRSLSHTREFDAAINWFSSFGYFDRETNDAVLRGFAKALRPGGRLLLELLNPGRLAKLMELTGGQSATMTERDDDLMIDRVRYDPRDGFSHTDRFVVRGGRVRRLQFSLEQVPADELEVRLRRAGFGSVELFGDGGAPFQPDGRRLIALATLGR